MTRQVDIGDSVDFLTTRKVFTQNSATVLKPSLGRKIKVPNLDNVEADVMFLCLLLDASGSMKCCRDSVIKAQNDAMEAFRGSAACRKNALYVSHYLFNDKVNPLQDQTQLATQAGDDEIIILSPDLDLYQPSGRTALYQTVHRLLQDIAALTAASMKGGLKPLFVVGLCTDGDDTEGGIKPEDIRQVMGELRRSKHLLTATVIGFESSEISAERFEEIKESIGFDKAIICSRSNPKDIRDAFCLWSQSIVALGNKL